MSPPNIPTNIRCLRCGGETVARAKVDQDVDVFYVAHVCLERCTQFVPVSVVARRWNWSDSTEGFYQMLGAGC